MSQALEVGKRLVEMCQQGQAEEAITELYADNIVSIEAQGSEEMPARMEGIDAIKKKSAWWFANNEVHSMETAGPFCGHRDDQFVVKFDIDLTNKESSQRMQMSEVGLYTIKDGKVVQEEFLYKA